MSEAPPIKERVNISKPEVVKNLMREINLSKGSHLRCTSHQNLQSM